YDATDGYGVLFGGESDSGCTWYSGLYYCSDTWAFADGAWTNLTYLSASHPSARAGAGFAYDAADGVVVLFGGYGPTSTHADTWSFHGGVWTDLTTKVSGAPAARGVPEMAYDWQEGYVLMFGGRDANGSESLGDTWSYSSETWTLLTPVHSPPPTDEGAMSFDSSLGIEILVGGWDVPWDASLIPLTQVWGFNGTDWAVVPTTPSPYSPLPTVLPTIADDPVAETTLLITGGDSEGGVTSAWTLAPSLQIVSFVPSPPYTEAGRSFLAFSVDAQGGSPWRSYHYFGLPAGCQTANTNDLVCTPTAATGNISVTVVVTDAASRLSVSAITAVDIVPRPTITSFVVSPTATDVGRPVTLAATEVGGFGPFTFAFSGLPEGCLPPDGAVVDCVPEFSGSYPVGVSVTDGLYEVANATDLLVVNPVPTMTGITLSSPVIDVGGQVTVAATVVGGTPPYEYIVTAPLDTCDDIANAEWRCTATSSGEQLVVVSVTDAVGVTISTSEYSEVNPLPRVTGFVADPPTLSLGNSTEFLVTTSGGSLPLAFNFSNLPQGCSTSDTAQLVCRSAEVGNFSPTVTVEDQTGATATANTSFIVEKLPSQLHGVSTAPGVSNFWLGLGIGATGGGLAVAATAAILVSRSRRGRPPRGAG
ncbi:MAG: kelch repeat-containing protein, partial [Thermoplasmata archaeon]|nr:kelch repeat-containing protein [Thermoplasmata archaeon]